MNKYNCTVIFDASSTVIVEAETPEEAAQIAEDEASGNQHLCHQCANTLETGDAIGVHVYDEACTEHLLDTTYRPPQPKREPLWIDPNDKTQAQFLPHIGEPVLFCHGGKTYYGHHNGGSFQYGYGVTKRHYNTWECRWMYLPAAHGIKGQP